VVVCAVVQLVVVDVVKVDLVDVVRVDLMMVRRLMSAFRETAPLLQLFSSAITCLELFPLYVLSLLYNRSPLTDGIIEPSFRAVDGCALS
jgi:hypothetical protein